MMMIMVMMMMMMLCAWCRTLCDKRLFIVGLFVDEARPLDDDDDDDAVCMVRNAV